MVVTEGNMGETNGGRWCLGGSRRTQGSRCEDSEWYNIVLVAGKPPRLVSISSVVFNRREFSVLKKWKCASTKKVTEYIYSSGDLID